MPSSGVQKSALDRKSTRLNSSHDSISYDVFCLKKKKTHTNADLTLLTRTLIRAQLHRSAKTAEQLEGHGRTARALAYSQSMLLLQFFFNDTATTEIYTLSLHDALPIFETRTRFKEKPTRYTQTQHVLHADD